MPDIHCRNRGGPVLQQAIGEAPGAGTKIHSARPSHIQGEMLERMLQFVPPTADIPIVCNQLDAIALPH
jgi:hypothetical protein